jgi:hypothetical protein
MTFYFRFGRCPHWVNKAEISQRNLDSLWVISGHMQCKRARPLCPQQRPRKRTPANGHVRFTTESGRVQCKQQCRLRANSGRRPSLFDQLVGALLELRGYIEAKCLRRLEIDDQLEFRWQLYWQLGWLCTFEDAIDVVGGALLLVDHIRSIGYQAAVHGDVGERINCGYPISGRQCDNQPPISQVVSVRQHNQAAVWLTDEFTNGTLDIDSTVNRRRSR